MKPDKLLPELEEVVQRFGYRVRRERGSFRGSSCVLEGENLIVLNRNQPVDVQVATLARLIRQLDHGSVFLKPAVRRELEALWDRFSSAEEPALPFEDPA